MKNNKVATYDSIYKKKSHRTSRSSNNERLVTKHMTSQHKSKPQSSSE